MLLAVWFSNVFDMICICDKWCKYNYLYFLESVDAGQTITSDASSAFIGS